MVIDDNRHSVGHKSFEQQHRRIQPEHRIAHPLDRMAAFIIDLAILFIFCSVAAAPFQKKIKAAQLIGESEQMVVGFLLIVLIVTLIALTYQFLWTLWRGATVGKLVFGLKPVDVWTGQKPKVFDLMMRSMAWWVDTFIFCLPHFGMYSDPLRRPFHDRVANTVVISTTSRKGHAPQASEMSLIRSLFIAIFVLGFILISEEVRKSYSLISTDEDANLLSLASPMYCDEVSEAQQEWPLENGMPANRVSIALALFAGGIVKEECLDQEAYLEFQLGDKNELAYLARAFATSEESALSDKYLDKVCEKSSESEACQLSKLISLWTERSWDKATEGFSASLKNASVFTKIWAIKHFEKVKDYAQEIKIINDLWPLPGINQFLSAHRTVALWGTHKKSESKISLMSAVETLPKSKQLGLSSWMCYAELEGRCDSEVPQSCQHFMKLSEETASAYSHDLYAITHMVLSECRGEDSLKEFKNNLDEPHVAKLLEAIESEEKGDTDQAQEVYKQLLVATESDSIIYHETAKRALALSDKIKDDSAFDQILEEWSASAAPDYWSWHILGSHIVQSLIERKRFEEATQVGQSILNLDNQNEDIKKQMVVAFYKNHNITQAKKYLESLEKQPAARSIASQDQFTLISRELKKARP